MKRRFAAFVSGLVFATGLCVSGMTRPQRVLAFLDVFGNWDPSLAFVMVGAIAVASIAFRVAARPPGAIESRRSASPAEFEIRSEENTWRRCEESNAPRHRRSAK